MISQKFTSASFSCRTFLQGLASQQCQNWRGGLNKVALVKDQSKSVVTDHTIMLNHVVDCDQVKVKKVKMSIYIACLRYMTPVTRILRH